MQWLSLALPVLLFAASLSFADDDPATSAEAEDELMLERTEITGNSELPKVLYIVPWQKSDPGALVGKPVNTLLDEVLAPLDREEFIRQVDYYRDLYGDQPFLDSSNVIPAPAVPDDPVRLSRESGIQ